MANGSSAKRVARLAQKGKGKKVRFQGGTLFPAVMTVIVVLGLVLIGYARESAPSKNTAPTANDHWHVSYGFYKCADPTKSTASTLANDAKFLDNLVGNKEEPLDPNFIKYGIHSHDDGVLHWHPSALASGNRAKLGVFFDVYGISVTKDKITFPDDQNGGVTYDVKVDKCKDSKGKTVDAVVKVVVWDQYDDPSQKKLFITDFDNIRIKKDGMAITIAYVAADADVPIPPTAANLPALGSKDQGGVTTTTIAGATTTTIAGATSTTIAGATTTTNG